MQKRFNTTGCCNPEWHYMVDISGKLAQIKTMIDNGCYFTINRARQFGKTTMMDCIYHELSSQYVIFQISFEGTDYMFSSQTAFCNQISSFFSHAYGITTAQADFWNRCSTCKSIEELSIYITDFCLAQEKPVLLMIDEVDKSSDNQIFLNFIGMLRNKYLNRRRDGLKSTFQSVILAGVYDVKNLKLKLRPDEERKYNSPWNIATDFKVDMSFCPTEIETMLNSYENDHKTGMDIPLIANEIYKYTSGYPFLVSKICELIDTELNKDWSIKNIQQAVKLIINNPEPNSLFKSIAQNILNLPEFDEFIQSISFHSKAYPFSSIDPMIELGLTFSYIKIVDNTIRIHNLIFEEVIYNFYVLRELRNKYSKLSTESSIYIQNGKLNMPYVIERFQKFMHNEYRKSDEQFIEKQGRLLFLCFLKPIINGKGFYYVEPQTRENNRMDIVVTYGEQEFVIELKIWRGEKYEIEGKEQLSEYLATRNLNEGYLVTFSFLKNKVIQEEPQWIEHNGKRIYEAVI